MFLLELVLPVWVLGYIGMTVPTVKDLPLITRFHNLIQPVYMTMTSLFKPLLAATVVNPEYIRFPVLGSPKLDGIRALVPEGNLVSRRLRPIDNIHTRTWFSQPELEGLDGELILGNPADKDCFAKTTSAVRTIEGAPRLHFWVFDDFTSPNVDFLTRTSKLKTRVLGSRILRVTVLPHRVINNLEELNAYEDDLLAEGHEGVMLRSPEGRYKFGRSTMKEQYLMKLKRFERDSARIIGFEEEMKNNNPATVNALGKIKRTKHKENLEGKGTLGALRVVVTSGPYKGKEVRATGISKAFKQEIWNNKDKYLRKEIVFKWFPIGSQDLPRHPTFEDFI